MAGKKFVHVNSYVRSKPKKIKKSTECKYCRGTGHEPGWVGRACKICKGRGII